jgi:hypothetical protein
VAEFLKALRYYNIFTRFLDALTKEIALIEKAKAKYVPGKQLEERQSKRVTNIM